MDEDERRRLAQPEIDKLNAIEVELEFLYASHSPGMSMAQITTNLSERRKVVELRARLSGIMPVTEVDNDH